MTIVWVGVSGFDYEVSSLGEVRRRNTRRLLKPEVTSNGYHRVALSKNGKKTRLFLHSLILECFVGPRPNGFHAAHIDGNPANNSIKNLAWKTVSANHMDKHRHGTMPMGERHHAAVLTDAEYDAIISSPESHQKVAYYYGLNKSTVAAIRRRHRIRTTTKE